MTKPGLPEEPEINQGGLPLHITLLGMLMISVSLLVSTITTVCRIDRLESAISNQAQPVPQPGHVYLLRDSLFFKSQDGEVILIKPTKSTYLSYPVQSCGNVIYPSSDDVKLIGPVRAEDTTDWNGDLIYDKP